MSEFVELKDGWWFRRSDITAFRVVPAFITPRISKPYVAVWVQGEPGEFHVEFDDLKQAEAAARKIRGVSQSEVAEKIEILDLIHKAKSEDASDEDE